MKHGLVTFLIIMILKVTTTTVEVPFLLVFVLVVVWLILSWSWSVCLEQASVVGGSGVEPPSYNFNPPS